MVSPRAGARPAYATRRTAAAAPVTTFTPLIPDNPSLHSLAQIVEPGHHANSTARIPTYLMLRASGTEPPAAKPRWKLSTWGVRATLLIQNSIGGGFRTELVVSGLEN